MGTLETRLRKLAWLSVAACLAGSQLVFWQQSEDAFGPIEAVWTKIFAGLGLACLTWGPSWKNLTRSLAARAVLLWCVWLFVNACFGAYPRQGIKTAFEYSLYAGLFFVPAALDEKQRRKALLFFLAAAGLAAVYGLFQHFGMDPWAWSTNFGGRPLGTIGNPDFFAGHMVMPWALGLGWLLFSGAGRPGPWIALALLSLVQVFSLTMGAYLGSFAALLGIGFIALTRKGENKKTLYWLAGMAAFCLVIALLPPIKDRLINFWQSKASSVTNRSLMWKAAVAMWKENFLAGKGLGSFRPLFPLYQSRILVTDHRYSYVVTWLPHENFLYLASETGLIGLGLFVLATGAGVANGWKRISQGPAFYAGCSAAIFGMQGVALLNTYSNIPPSAAVYWFLLGLLAFPAPQATVALATEKAWAQKVFLATALSLALSFGFFGVRQVLANRAMKQGHRLVKQGELGRAAELFEKAIRQHVWELSPQTIVGVNYELGECLRQLGRLPEAAQAYADDLNENPWCPETHNMLGATLGQMGKNEEAMKHLQIAAQMSPAYTAAMTNLGITYAQTRQFSQAAQVWDEVLKIEPENRQVKDYLAKLKFLK